MRLYLAIGWSRSFTILSVIFAFPFQYRFHARPASVSFVQISRVVYFPLFSLMIIIHSLQVAPCKGIQASRGFRIPHRGFRNRKVGFRIPCLWIPDSRLFKIPDSKALNFAFLHRPIFCTLSMKSSIYTGSSFALQKIKIYFNFRTYVLMLMNLYNR